MSEKELAILCDWLMVSDPWPLASEDRRVIEKMLNKDAVEYGFSDWLDCYHRSKWSRRDHVAVMRTRRSV